MEAGIFFSDQFYHLGDGHPMNENRLITAWQLFQELGMPNTKIFSPKPASQDDIELIHAKDYVEEVKNLSKESSKETNRSLSKFGLGTGDCPIFPGMYDGSLMIAGSTLQATDLVLQGEIKNAFILMAGLHHAQYSNASGFCYFNDMSIAIKHLRNQGYRVAYIDTDLHHGDGVQAFHYNDPEVLTLSFHESGQFLYPGTGFSNEIGEGEAKGSSINLPFFPYTYDEIYQKSFMTYVPKIIETFNPDFIIWQAGVDGHASDPLGHLLLSTNTFQLIGKSIKYLSDKYCDGMMIGAGGGGYSPFSIARSWYTEYAALNNILIPKRTPEGWKDDYNKRYDEGTAPEFMADEKSSENLVERPESVIGANAQYRTIFHEELDKYYNLPEFG